MLKLKKILTEVETPHFRGPNVNFLPMRLIGSQLRSYILGVVFLPLNLAVLD